MTYRSKVVIERPLNPVTGLPGELEQDPATIGDHPADWATAPGQYVLGIIPDPLDPSRPKTAWILITAAGLAGGYGYYGRD